MRTTIIVNSLKELKTVANFYGIEVKSSEIAVSFPYKFEVDVSFDSWDNSVISFEEFEVIYLKNN